jgi:hypothetical protein
MIIPRAVIPTAPRVVHSDGEGSNTLINPFNAKLHPICHLLALLKAHLIFHVSRIRVNASQ